ncbi:sterile alpha motif domain-containing protein 9-like [Sander lucioperca]|uniref:sterile alpha motif domain-containing protein 9-like n=1 Tax=Sander lucioperca TaxID=283035 RepID=UPI00125E614F|nr:sterile alpha motif domain-containing protein 9-like [Sander lucioperca]XP_031134869.1 sterile alpha motif domain-containing protein 9-like [Sander lucioperca]XP_031134871.1 sterile alpha motif domain-containing protein 9-like [Sander lucioperca]XP_031134872.1 sterile alpha motif domain-containing protein 9-like [Sander lucioperca]
MADEGEMKNEEDLPPDIKDWSKHQVREWTLKLKDVDDKVAEILFQQDINGPSLLLLDTEDLKQIGVTFGPAKLIIHARDEGVKLQKEEPTSSTNLPGSTCKPYPFRRYDDTYRYMESSILDITESGPSDLIEPCHEYKAFTNTTDETKMSKFTEEAIRFAAACMNSRTNGTIHFGIGDEPNFSHGQVLGVVEKVTEAYANALKSAIDGYFEHKHKQTAQNCIKHPRFVGVLNKNMTSSEKFVIEVDIVPDSTLCEENNYHTFNMDTKKAKKKAKGKETVTTDTKPSKQFFVRDGGSSRDLLAQTTSAKPMEEYNRFVDSVAQRSQLRKQAEEKHLSVIKSSSQGSRLSQMITGGSLSLDKSHFEQYVVVANKSHPIQFESLGFLVELNPTAVLDFDPESAKCGLQCHFEQQSTVSVHLPAQYKITEGVEDIANKLKLTRNTSWVFCNGGIEDEIPSDIDEWLMDKGASIRDVISFLCRKDVLPNKRFLVIFLLLSTVSEKMDPLVEAFSTFLQELKGTDQILCICNNEKAFTSWTDLINARCGNNISHRCIYELSFAEVNGTVLSLLSKNRKSSRFLPCGGESKVLLEKKVERSLNTLEVLCVNQCEGGNEDKIAIEENFYKGGKVSWWNFYFSEQPGSTPFIKRDKFDFIMNTVLPDLCSLRKACVLLNLMHVPGCGGTTLAMHTLWAHRARFRCAVLKDSNADFAEVADQVVKLLMHDHKEQLPRVPVLLMIDDFDDKEKVFDLQQLIEKECVKKDIQSKSPQVIILNCMRSESSDQTEPTEEMVFIGNNLSETEQKLFEDKLKVIEKTHKNADTFYGFMIMKKNFKPEYVQGVARNTLKSFNINQKHAQLLAVLVLLNVYCKNASLSVSLCEEFLGLQPKPICGTIKVEDGFGKFSTLVATCSVQGMVVFKAVKMIHSSIASHCLQELTTTHNVSKADITDLLLTTDKLYESTQGKDKLLQDVHYILVKRHHSMEESKFSPLIQDILGETPGLEEMVLQNASKRFPKDAVVSQLLARYYYLKKKDFSEAEVWAYRARDLSKDSSYFADTSAQVIKHKLKDAIANYKEVPICPEKLDMFLKMAQSAIDAFKDTQNLAKKESIQRLKTKTDNCPFNTAGCLGEIQVGVLVIEVLEKTPIFSSDSVRHDIMSGVLSGAVKLQAVETNDKRHNKHTHHYKILKQFEDVLYNLRYRMKVNFDFLDNFYVNLGSRSGMKDSREHVVQNELFRCFRQYVKLFCKTDSAALLKNKTLHNMLKLHEARQYLEMQKADTYSGILNRLSNDISPEIMKKIARLYAFVCAPEHKPTVKERINFIYVNVVLSCIKLESQHLEPYQKLHHLLCQVLHEQIPISENLPLHFIAVVLLWPQQYSPEAVPPRSLGNYISQMRTSYHTLMKEVYNGKRPMVHFFLGKKQGYERLVHLGEIKGCIKAGQEEFASMWENGKIWKEKKVEECLLRVTGEAKNNIILADTCFPDLKVEVTPMFQSQLSGYAPGSKVSFIIGFSMKGPVALDIN